MEVTQYKHYVIPTLESMQKHKTMVQELEDTLIEFPSTMPQSTIIFQPQTTKKENVHGII